MLLSCLSLKQNVINIAEAQKGLGKKNEFFSPSCDGNMLLSFFFALTRGGNLQQRQRERQGVTKKVEVLPYALITATFVLFKVGKRKLLLIMAVAAGKNRASVFREAKKEAGFQMIYWNKEKFCRTLIPKSVEQ
ncbi:hypothetical protein CDAR_576551 [Caerostris darwini]|uniref:Uncharacterized protein n=1 Tax=Caerostris darwini TaxID=1538125 RepID=A0AAV4TKS5_9ARAC|nr:hypothetical protein CDAR_576551 [Caerostris darwini]